MMNMNSKSSVNEFTIKIANVNGTGSASANGLLMKSLFRMGIPVVGKNYFPSNIQGLPTWYEIRASEKGYLARSGKVDIMVAMNAETYKHDLAEVVPGGYLIYDSTWPRHSMLTRDDITIIGVPLSRMCNETFPSARARILMKNVVYVGVIAALLDLDMELISREGAEDLHHRRQGSNGGAKASPESRRDPLRHRGHLTLRQTARRPHGRRLSQSRAAPGPGRRAHQTQSRLHHG